MRNNTTFDTVMNIISSGFIVGAALMTLFAAIGLLRFPDVLSRVHAATKPQVLGIFLMVLALACALRRWNVLPLLLLLWVFQVTTIPLGAHMLSRVGYRNRKFKKSSLIVDDFNEVLEKEVAQREQQGNKPQERT